MTGSLAARLHETRKARLLTQSELGRLAGVHPIQVSRIETRAGGVEPRAKTIRLLATALGVRPEWLATGEPPKRPKPGPNGATPEGSPDAS